MDPTPSAHAGANARRDQPVGGALGPRGGRYLFPSRFRGRLHLLRRQHARIVHRQAAGDDAARSTRPDDDIIPAALRR